jgi:hypothetical protein
MDQFTVTEFVKGLARHDIAKPFALEGWRHARLGYWLLALSGKPMEALTALRHDTNVRNKYFDAKRDSAKVPAVTMLGNALDKLASAVYSLQIVPTKTDCHSLQNPFTRLPMTSDLLREPFLVDGRKELRQLESELWQVITQSLPAEWQVVLTQAAKAKVENNKAPLPVDVRELPAGQDALSCLCRAMKAYPERTYPPMNDTTLRRHGRLTGVFGFVVYQNLSNDPNIDVRSVMQSKTAPGQYQNPNNLVQTHLKACLVRVTLEGLRAWFHQAARVDDMLGTLALTSILQQAFKRTLAASIGTHELVEWLTLSESQFELFYLIPSKQSDIQVMIRDAYRQAVRDVATTIVAERLSRDFPNVAGYQSELEQQLGSLVYGVRVIPVPPPPQDDHNRFVAAYGKALLRTYIESQKHVLTPTESVLRGHNMKDLPADQVCDVCGTHPTWQPPTDSDDEGRAEWLKKRDRAAHTFRGETERVCVSCVARRELAFGSVAKRLNGILDSMFQHDERTGLWHAVQPETGPNLPPLLKTVVDLKDTGIDSGKQEYFSKLLDAEAFFVRSRAVGDSRDSPKLELFPTVSYAADQNGNVVLMVLTPKPLALFGSYTYAEALKTYGPQPLVDELPDESNWRRAVADFYHERIIRSEKENEKELEAAQAAAAAVETVEPHMARVMERITQIKRFYTELTEQLMNRSSDDPRPPRVLPLDLDYPTLRLLVPANRLDDVLRTLDQVVTTSLLSASYESDPEARAEIHNFLNLVTPDLLHGAIIVFKHKYPLYLALDAERNIMRSLVDYDQENHKKDPHCPHRSNWYGFRLGFTDLRGSLSEAGPLHATVTYQNLGEILDLVSKVDRRTVLQYHQTTKLSKELAEAQAVVRTRRVRDLEIESIKRFDQKGVFGAVHFIKRVIRG